MDIEQEQHIKYKSTVLKIKTKTLNIEALEQCIKIETTDVKHKHNVEELY